LNRSRADATEVAGLLNVPSIRLSFRPPRLVALGLMLLGLMVSGCSNRPSTGEALDRAIRESGGTKLELAKFAGRVTVDGQPPSTANHHALIVMLYDPKKPPTEKNVLLHTFCDERGHFEFGTYTRSDGVPAGSYLVLFGHWRFKDPGFRGPDGLKNLYNDPDKSEFPVDATLPGKTDYQFEPSFKDAAGIPRPDRARSPASRTSALAVPALYAIIRHQKTSVR
jgi:hypothetical protein